MTGRIRIAIITAIAVLAAGITTAAVIITLNSTSEADRINNALASAEINTSASDNAERENSSVSPVIYSDGISADENNTDDNAAEDNDNNEAVTAVNSTNSAAEDGRKPVNSDTMAVGAAGEPVDIADDTFSEKEKDDTKPGSGTAADTAVAPETTKAAAAATTTKPAATTVTSAPEVTAPPSTVRTDLPKVTAAPEYTTAPTTAAAAQPEPTEVKLDENGFPANPVDGQKFIDTTGQEWMYMDMVGTWIQGTSGNVNVEDFPDFPVEDGDEIILG